jgi:glycosyltransferase involved in cell wall biosynthesis
MKLPEVSIIVAAHNAAQHIERAIRSCINQTFFDDNYEIVVIDDGSTDATPRICQEYGQYIEYYRNKENLGLPAAINAGIRRARSRYIVRVDSDDYVHEDFIKVLYLHMSMNACIQAVACDYLVIDDSENVAERFDCNEHPIGCGIMFRKERLIEVGLYDETFAMAEEVDLRMRFEKRWAIHRVELPLYRYMRHGNNMTENKELYGSFIQRAVEKNERQ